MSKINFIVLLGLCLGFSNTLYAAQNDEVDEKKENIGNNGQDAQQAISNNTGNKKDDESKDNLELASPQCVSRNR